MHQLSEEMRLGSMLRPQGYGRLYRPDKDATCALGAAMESMGLLGEGTPVELAFPILAELTRCPVITCEVRHLTLLHSVVTHLNDHHRMSREKIADFVATVEARCDANVAPQRTVPQPDAVTMGA